LKFPRPRFCCERMVRKSPLLKVELLTSKLPATMGMLLKSSGLKEGDKVALNLSSRIVAGERVEINELNKGHASSIRPLTCVRISLKRNCRRERREVPNCAWPRCLLSCAVGPDYQMPDTPVPNVFLRPPIESADGVIPEGAKMKMA
jgi:hypothetical protein